MALQAPQAGEPKVIFNAGRGRAMVERKFFYDDREEIYRIWWCLHKPPALIFPITKDRQVVAIRQFRAGANDFMLELPGGMPNENGKETHQEVAERELLEETGYLASKVIDLGCAPYFDAPSFNFQFIPFLGLGCSKVKEPEPDESEKENIETILIPLEKWYEKIWRGEILDNKAISHSLLILPYIGRITFDL